MCGIAGIYLSGDKNSLKISSETIIRMSDSIKHRGPDDYGYYITDKKNNSSFGHLTTKQLSKLKNSWSLLLGHRRLSIIDLSEKGRQPMSDEEGRFWITYNGEIYNYVELKEELVKKGHNFKTSTDTEVVINAYKEWGKECVNKFNGMWAFAIWDGKNNELFCSRDRFGIKPFYYYFDGGTFIFASEIKAILEALPQNPVPDTDTIYEYVVDGSLCHNKKTFFKNISRLLPGHNLTLKKNGGINLDKYWSYNSEDTSSDHTDNEDRFFELLKDSVRLRLRSDVQNGLTLSGGMDSSAIAALCDDLKENDIHTYSAVFPGYKLDESEYIETVVKEYNLNSNYIYPKPTDFTDSLKKMIWHMDYPSLSRPAFSYFEIMKEIAKSDSKVILEGQGADEELAGYIHKYFHLFILDTMKDKNLSFLDKSEKVLKACSNTFKKNGLKPFIVSIGKLFPPLHMLFKKIIGITSVLNINQRSDKKEENGTRYESNLINRLYKDHSRENLPYLLKYGDALSMANSIESRLPFLDYRLVEFIFQLNYDEIMDENNSKSILRKSMTNFLPDKILNRNKIGFATPFGDWFNKNIKTMVQNILLSDEAVNRKIYNHSSIKRLIKIHESGIIDISNYLYRLISLELWFRIFIDTEKAPDKI